MASLALLVFFTFFVIVLYDAWRKSSDEIHHLENLPLEDDKDQPVKNQPDKSLFRQVGQG